MSDQQRFDSDTSQRLFRSYRTDDIVQQRRFVRRGVAATDGERVLDVGCGPGLLAQELANDVGPGGRIEGIDNSEDMLAIARDHPPATGAAPITYSLGPATSLPYPDESFDVVVSTQVLEYIPEIELALAEIRRVLVPGGRAVILDTDWDSLVWRTSDPARHDRIARAWDDHLHDPFLPRRLPSLLAAAGFTGTETEVYGLLNVGDVPDTFSHGLIRLIGAYVPGRHGVTEDEVKAWRADLESLGDEYFFSLNRYLFTARRPT